MFAALNPRAARSVDEKLFRLLLELEFDKAQRLHYFISVLCLSITPRLNERWMRHLTDRFTDRLRSTDVVTLTSGSSWTFLLVGAQPESLKSIILRITEHLGTLSWCAGGASYPDTALGVDDLLVQAKQSQTICG